MFQKATKYIYEEQQFSASTCWIALEVAFEYECLSNQWPHRYSILELSFKYEKEKSKKNFNRCIFNTHNVSVSR